LVPLEHFFEDLEQSLEEADGVVAVAVAVLLPTIFLTQRNPTGHLQSWILGLNLTAPMPHLDLILMTTMERVEH
jgi:hypothetical protein